MHQRLTNSPAAKRVSVSKIALNPINGGATATVAAARFPVRESNNSRPSRATKAQFAVPTKAISRCATKYCRPSASPRACESRIAPATKAGYPGMRSTRRGGSYNWYGSPRAISRPSSQYPSASPVIRNGRFLLTSRSCCKRTAAPILSARAPSRIHSSGLRGAFRHMAVSRTTEKSADRMCAVVGGSISRAMGQIRGNGKRTRV